MTRFVAVMIAIVTLAACAPRGTITLDPAAAQVGQVHQVFVGTTRAVDPKTGQFDSDRHEGVDYAQLDVSVPPDRALGTITFPHPGRAADPRKDFLTTSETFYAGPAAFRADLGRALRAQAFGRREAVVYVHGYNNTFAEGVYRIAQISQDLSVPGVAVHYAWPSAANPLNYAYDRDSVLFARDGLEQLLAQVVAAGADRILLVGHSMGAMLVMETLRQMKLDGNIAVTRHLGGIVLISPDLDVDVFRTEAVRIGTLPQPFIIFTSQKDNALALSARLTGQRHRLGNLADATKVADLKVTLLDVGAFSEGVGHFTAATSPALLRILGRVNDLNSAYAGDQTGKIGLLPGVMLTVQNATQVILMPVSP